MEVKVKKSSILGIVIGVLCILFSKQASAITLDCSNVSYYSDLQKCLNNSSDITLNNNITDAPTIIYNQPGESVTINMNGYNISSIDGLGVEEVFAIVGGTISFTGEGIIGKTQANAAPIRIVGSENISDTAYTTVNIGPRIGLTSSENYGIIIGHEDRDHSYATVLNFEGAILARRGIYVMDHLNDIENYPSIHIADNSRISATDGPAIEASGYANWDIGAAKIFGDDGIGIKQGRFYIDGAEVIADGDNNPNPQVRNDELFKTGAAIQIMTLLGKTNRSEVYIKSGSFESKNGYAIVEYAGNDESDKITLNKFEIYTGTFKGSEDFDGSVLSTATGALPWFFGDGRLASDGSYFVEVGDLWDSHRMTIARYADVAGFDKIYNDPRFADLERILPVYSPYENLYFAELDALEKSEYKNTNLVNIFDISLRGFNYDIGDPEPGMSKPYFIISNTSEDFPITFTFPLPELAPPDEEKTREYYVLNFHYNYDTGEYDVVKLPTIIDDVSQTYSFITHQFSTFVFAYEDEIKQQEPEKEPEGEEEDNPEQEPEEEPGHEEKKEDIKENPEQISDEEPGSDVDLPHVPNTGNNHKIQNRVSEAIMIIMAIIAMVCGIFLKLRNTNKA